MARTRMFSALQRALDAERVSHPPRALSRRQFLTLAAASASIAACSHLGFGGSKPDVAIVGGGVAGLTVAYRLSQAGVPATIYEASPRLGGRMFTKRGFNADGMFCELGGELVDTNHAPLIALAKELGVGIQPLKVEGAEDLYFLGGKLHTEHELLYEGKGAYRKIADQIAKDQAALLNSDESWTDRARALDAMSIKAYLAQFQGHAPAWVLELLELAYRGEYGVSTDQQSALNLVDLIGADPASDFAMFGNSDEAFRIQGGSSSLTDALASRLGSATTVKLQHSLTKIEDRHGKIALSLLGPSGAVTSTHDTVVLAIPFTTLRKVSGLDALGFEAKKLQCIRELGYGDNAKVMIGTRSRPWTEPAAFPARSDGEFYTKEFQVLWETSRGQTGASGILTNYLTGVGDAGSALQGLGMGLRAFAPKMIDSLDPSKLATMFWARNPNALGSFSAAKVGQYTTLLEVAATPELGGRLQFAGEHTSADFPGFMCGGVESGERAAKALLSAHRHDKKAA